MIAFIETYSIINEPPCYLYANIVKILCIPVNLGYNLFMSTGDAISCNGMLAEEAQKARILIVDDEPANLALLSTVMMAQGYRYETAQNGTECLEKVKAARPDIILLDVFMPEMDGIEACRAIKSDLDTCHIPVIFLTSHTDSDIKFKCLDAGANDFLSKPVDGAELVVKVGNMLKLKAIDEFRISNRVLTEAKKALEEKNRELEKAYADLKGAQAQILRQEKMASIGQLAAGVAHEINNPVGFVMSNLNTLLKFNDKLTEFIRIQSDALEDIAGGRCSVAEAIDKVKDLRNKMKIEYIVDDLKNLINESIDGMQRMKHIVQDLKSFARDDDSKHVTADINKGLESTINVVWNELKYKATLSKEYGELPFTVCNPGQLNQVFMNLLVNAAQAIEKHGEIAVKTWPEGRYICVSIADTGSGMPPEITNKIFEPFFTTKEVGKGTGLGLSIAYDIVKKHNGELTVESEVGKGSTFTIRIPVIEK